MEMVKRRAFVACWSGEEDVITWVLRAVVDVNPGAVKIFEVEQAARNHWGGARPYIGKRRPIAKDGQVPRTTFHRWVRPR
jgi:hypothetical protein